jgi:hypothetical protein
MIPLELKIAYTALVAVIVVVYWFKYGPANFLWGSDIALLVAVPALWLEHSLLASMMTLGVLIPEALWNLSYFWRLFTGKSFIGLADYMFDPAKPGYLRALSLFHVPLPLMLLWMVHVLGYDRAALLWQTPVCWLILVLSVWLTDPRENVNWVHGLGTRPLRRISPNQYRALLMVAVPVVIYLPTHVLLSWLF